MSWERRKYQKAVNSKKDLVVDIEAIEPAAKKHCNILRRSAVTVPGVPAKSFIFSLQNQEKFRFLMGYPKHTTIHQKEKNNRLKPSESTFSEINSKKKNKKERNPFD